MRITVFGAAGNVGRRVVAEALSRGHQVTAEGRSAISMEDLAVALLDEAEQPRHHRTRFTVGY